jgi:hypothetical protein
LVKFSARNKVVTDLDAPVAEKDTDHEFYPRVAAAVVATASAPALSEAEGFLAVGNSATPVVLFSSPVAHL